MVFRPLLLDTREGQPAGSDSSVHCGTLDFPSGAYAHRRVGLTQSLAEAGELKDTMRLILHRYTSELLNVLEQREQKSESTAVAFGHIVCYGIVIILRETGLEKHFYFRGASIIGY